MHNRTVTILLLLTLTTVVTAAGPPGEPPDPLEQAKQLADAGQYEQAEQLYQAILAEQPSPDEAVPALKGLAILYVRSGQDAEAKQALEDLVTGYSDHWDIARAVTHVADACREMGKHNDALETYGRVIAAWPDDEHALWSQMGIAMSQACLKDAKASDAAVEELCSTWPGHHHLGRALCIVADNWRRLGSHEKARDIYNLALASNPDPEFAMWSRMGLTISSMRLGDAQAAQAETKKLIEQFSEDRRLATALCTLGDEYRKQREYDKACGLYQEVLDNHRDSEAALWCAMNLGISNILRGNSNGADAAAERLLLDFGQDERMAFAALTLGDEYRRAQRHEKARELYQYVVASRPDSEQALWSQMGLAAASLLSGDDAASGTATATERLLADFSGDERSATAVCLLADEHRRMGKYQDALRLYDWVVTNWPNAEHAMWSQMGLAVTYVHLGDDEHARIAIGELGTRFSNRDNLSQAVREIAREYREVGKYEEAENVRRYVEDGLASVPVDNRSVWSEASTLISQIPGAADESVHAAIDGLITTFGDDPDSLSKATFKIGHRYYSQARLYLQEGRDDQVDEFYRKAISVWERIIRELPVTPTTPWAYYCCAVCYSQELAEYEKGIEYYQAIVDNWPDYRYAWDAQFFVAEYYEILRRSGGVSESEANLRIEKACKGVLERYPDSPRAPSAALKLASMSRDKGAWLDAAGYYELFLQKKGDERTRNRVLTILYGLGRTLEKQAGVASAAQMYAVFITFADPADPRVAKAEEDLIRMGVAAREE